MPLARVVVPGQRDRRTSTVPKLPSSPTRQAIRTTSENSPAAQNDTLSKALKQSQAAPFDLPGLEPVAAFPTINPPGEVLSGFQVTRPQQTSPYNVPNGVGSGGGGDIGSLQTLGSFMSSLRFQESSGNYQAVGPPTKYGRATGAYQFLDSTWQSQAGQFASQYPSAHLAPPAVQDQVAAAYMTNLFNKYHRWDLVAIAWHAGPGVADQVAAGGSLGSIGDGGISTAQYVADIIGRI